MAEEVGYLARGQGFDVAVFILRAVDQSRGKGVTEAVETFCFDARGFEDPVESFAEVDGAGNLSVLVGDERAVLAEVKFFAEVFDHLDRGVVERDVTLAGGALQLADSHLSAALCGDSVALADLFYSALNVHDTVVQIDVGIEQAERFARPQTRVQHQNIRGCLLIFSLAVAEHAECFRLEFFDFFLREHRDGLRRREIFFPLG